MPAICPKCKNPLQLEQIPIKRDLMMGCSSCNAPLKVSLVVTLEGDGEVPASATAPQFVGSGPKVITIVEGEASNELIREILSTNGFSVGSASDAGSVLDLVRAEKPAIVIVDVGIPELMGFQIAEKISEDKLLKETGVILLASIHDATKYKREPDSLYGADDYIERHHIQDKLVPKIQKIISQKQNPSFPSGSAVASPAVESTQRTQEGLPALDLPPAGEASGSPEPAVSPQAEPPVVTEKAQEIEKAMSIEQVFDSMLEEERQTAAAKTGSAPVEESPAKPAGDSLVGDPAAHEAAKRLARIIVSDIALYNQKAVEEGVKDGTFHQLLKDEIEEGKKLYEGRVPGEIRSSTDYFKETIQDFIDKKKASA